MRICFHWNDGDAYDVEIVDYHWERTMTANDLLAEMHPGRTILDDVVKPLGMSVNALAKELHVPATRLNDIVRGRRGVTPDTALRLGRYLGTTAQFWLNLQSCYELRKGLLNDGKDRRSRRPLTLEGPPDLESAGSSHKLITKAVRKTSRLKRTGDH